MIDKSSQKSVIREKSFEFASKVSLFCWRLQKERKEYNATNQLFRSATSIGANIREAKYGQSVPDFISKMSIALKEASETEYWLLFLEKIIPQLSEEIQPLISENKEILRLLTSIVRTTKQRHQNPRIINY